MLLFNHRQTGKDPIDTCFRQQMGHKRQNSFQRVYLFVSCHGLNQGATTSGWILLPFQSMEKKLICVNNTEPALGKEKSWLLLKFYCRFCSKRGYGTSEMLDLQARCLKYEYSHLQNFKQNDESLLKNKWEYKNFFLRMQSTTVLFKNRFSFIWFESNSI